jgi:flagellar biosynthesis/type III secretory pathway protein FliH
LSSKVLRRAVFEEDPLIIDNEFAVPYEAGEFDADNAQDDLVEALQQEHPDAMPDEIEDAIQEAMDQLLQTPEVELETPMLGEEELLPEEPIEAESGLLAEEPEIVAPEPALSSDTLLSEARHTAAEIVESARREAQQVMAEADERAAEIERAAYDKGYEEGIQSGRGDGETQAAEMIKQVVAIVDQSTELHDTMQRVAEAEMVALCLEIARKTIHAELRTNPDVVKGVLEDAIKKINGSPRVTIKVNPSQLEAVRGYWESAFGQGYREKEWAFEADGEVEPGGCVLDAKYGSIDARIGTQFGEIQKTFALLLGTE